MIRNLKTLGVALAAVFAFSAMTASGAMAQETPGHITSTAERFTLTGTEVEGGVNVFTGPFGSEVECPGAIYTGHKVLTHEQTTAGSTHQLLTKGDTETTITPHYGTECNDNGSPRTVNMNGCDYRFSDATTTGEESGTYGIKVDIVCPSGKTIAITGGACTVTVGPQTGLTGLHVTNEGEHIRLKGSLPNISSKACGFTISVTQHQDVTISGDDADGKAVPVSISDVA